MSYTKEIQNPLLISQYIDEEPYIKDITNDKVINITGESGSGISYFSDKYIKDNFKVKSGSGAYLSLLPLPII